MGILLCFLPHCRQAGGGGGDGGRQPTKYFEINLNCLIAQLNAQHTDRNAKQAD